MTGRTCTLAHRLVLALGTGAAVVASMSACRLPDTTAGTPSPPHDGTVVPFSATCNNDGTLARYSPHTPSARAAALRACMGLDHAIDTAPWPPGVHPPGEPRGEWRRWAHP